MSPVIVPPAFGKAAFAVVVVEVNTESLAEISTPSTVSEPDIVILAPLKTRLPDIVPPAFGKAAFAVVVVEVNTASLAAMSTPSTVPPTVKFPAMSAFVLLSSMTALDAGNVQNTSFVPD